MAWTRLAAALNSRVQATFGRDEDGNPAAVYRGQDGQEFPISAVIGTVAVNDTYNPGTLNEISIDLAEFLSNSFGVLLPVAGDTVTIQDTVYTVFRVAVDAENMIKLGVDKP